MKISNFLIIKIIACVFLLSCYNKKDRGYTQNGDVENVDIYIKKNATPYNQECSTIIEKKVDFTFLTEPQKVVTKEDDTLGCQDWVLTKIQINDLLKSMRQASPQERHSLCYEYPCYYEAIIRYKGKTFSLIINAASFIEIFNTDEQFIFILEDENESFLIPCNCCDD